MRKIFLILVLFSLCVFAAIDQTYDHSIDSRGESVIWREASMSFIGNEFDHDTLEKIADVCAETGECEVDVENEVIRIMERFSPGNYYKYESEYDLLTITNTVEIRRIPTDRFNEALEELLKEAKIIDETSGDSARAIDLLDENYNAEASEMLRFLGANITYTVRMESNIYEAKSGEANGTITGNSASFDLVEVMEQSKPIVVKSSGLNYGNIIIGGAIIVLGALTLSFIKDKKSTKKKKTKKKK